MYTNTDPVLRVPRLKGKDKHTGDEIASLDAGLNDTDKWFANVSVHRVPLRRVGPTPKIYPRESDSEGLGWVQMLPSDKFLGDSGTAGLETTLWRTSDTGQCFPPLGVQR